MNGRERSTELTEAASQPLREQVSLLACAGWAGAFITGWICIGTCLVNVWWGNDLTAWGFFFLTVPIFWPAMDALLSPLAFPLPYSAFGKLKRTPLPTSGCVDVFTLSWGRIGSLISQMGFMTWWVYPTGVGIRSLGMGKVFLPSSAVVSLEYQGKRRCVISHTHHELRSPVVCPALVGRVIERAWRWNRENGDGVIMGELVG
jgi:hypothetical protein